MSILFFFFFFQDSAEQWAKKVAQSYGFSNLSEIKTLSYTFRVNRKGKIMERSWVWNMKSNEVIRIIKNGTSNDSTYFNTKLIHSLSPDSLKRADHQFINDQYWLCFPFHLLWDESVSFRFQTNQEVNDFKVQRNKLTVQYHNDSGYTPGDSYDLYITDEGKIDFWAYRAKSSEKASFVMQWKDSLSIASILFTTRFVNASGDFEIELLDIRVTK